MKNWYLIHHFIHAFLMCIAGLLISSCTQSKEQPAIAKETTKITSPRVTIIANLPDSSKPKVTLLANSPKPITRLNFKPSKTHSFIDSLTGLPLAHEVQGNGFFTIYTTDNGLVSDLIACSTIDKNGAIWFGSPGAGVSKYDGKTFTTYTTAQGLAHNAVRSILEDSKGNLWFGTYGGVSKYDGKTFTNYTTALGLANIFVLAIAEDKKGNLWFGTGFGMNGGVSKYDGKTFTTYTTTQGLAHNELWSITEDSKGNMWFGTNGGGVSKYDGNTFSTYTTAEGLADNYVTSILEDKKGNIWFTTGSGGGTGSGGLSKYDGKIFTTYTTAQGLASNQINSSFEDSVGNLWFGTDRGVSKYDSNTFTTYSTAQGLASNHIFSILEDRAGNLWFTTMGGGISKYSGKSLMSFTTAHGLGNSLVLSILEDKKGNLWFGTYYGGISKYDGKSLETYTNDKGLEYNILCSLEDSKGNLWFGGSNAGVSKYNGKEFITYSTSQGLVHNFVGSILEDKAGNLWFSTQDGVSNYDGKSFTTYTTSQGLAHNAVVIIREDSKGNLWFGTEGGVSKYDGKTISTYTTAQSSTNNAVQIIREDSKGNLWFGTLGGGVSKYDGKQFITYTTSQGLADNHVYSIREDSQGNLWFGTEGGLSVIPLDKLTKESDKELLQKPLFTSFTTQDGLPSNAIVEVLEDTEGKLIILTHSGIALLKKGIRSFGVEGSVELYSSANGYPIKSLTSLFKDSKGILWIGTTSDKTGLIRFDRQAVYKTKNTPVLVLQQVKINNKTLSWNTLLPSSKREKQNKELDSFTTPALITEEVTALGRVLSNTERENLRGKFGGIQFDSITPWYPLPTNMVLPYQHNSISFGFNAIETNLNAMIKYQYMLEGYDEDWSSLSDNTSAIFGNMYEGKYTFKVKALSPEGVWSKPIIYAFTILPPWWRTWWAYGSYVVAFGGCLWGFTHYRSRQLRAEKRLLEQKVSLRTAEVLQQKEEISAQRDQLENTIHALKSTQTQLIQKEKMASLGELTAGIAHEIQNPLNFVNNFSEVSEELCSEIEEEIKAGNTQEVLSITADLKQNLEKIAHHGKRADSIVKGMLEHSKAGSGEKQPTAINVLAEEYLQLSYHGIKAKAKDFLVDFKLEADPAVGKVEVAPQEIGRVLLNLYNNAFYATAQKKSQLNGQYQPEVRVSTKKIDDKVEISVKDNGIGIPDNVKHKIFQPFFTTKPTGEGTGLGLSLSYDIITKGHGGELKVDSKEGEYTEFTITIPHLKVANPVYQ